MRSWTSIFLPSLLVSGLFCVPVPAVRSTMVVVVGPADDGGDAGGGRLLRGCYNGFIRIFGLSVRSRGLVDSLLSRRIDINFSELYSYIGKSTH